MVVNHLLVKMVRASGLGTADRSLGAVFGLLRGIVIVTVFTMFAALTPLTADDAWRRSVVAGYVGQVAAWAAQFMPQDVAERVQAGLQG
jgi:membrane protein required for colicin V production